MSRRVCSHQPAEIATVRLPASTQEVTGPAYAGWWTTGTCEYGRCTELCCPVCGCVRGGWGPVGCPCASLTGYRDMRPAAHHAPVKAALARRTRLRRSRWRL